MLSLPLTNFILVGVGILNAGFGLFVWLQGERSRTTRTFLAITVNLAFWSFALAVARSADSPESALFLARLVYAVAAGIPYLFFLFTRGFLLSKKEPTIHWSALLLALVVFLLALLSDAVVQGVEVVPGQPPQYLFGSLYGVFVFYVLGYFAAGIFSIASRLRAADPNSMERIQLRFILVGSFLPIVVSAVANIFLLSVLRDFTYQWVGPASTLAMTVLFTYAITRHHLFNVKVITTELLTFAIWIFLLLQTLLSRTVEERLINGGLLGLVVIFGILLVRSVLKEIEQRTEFEGLTAQLSAANLELERLDRRRGEFISLAGHQLRTPLSIIKGYASMLLERMFGAIGERSRETLERVSVATDQLVKMVDDLLNLSEIEAGKTKYDLSPGDLSLAVREVTEEFSAHAKTKGITLELETPSELMPSFPFDREKISEAIGNIIDNAIKYSPRGGTVRITFERSDHAVRLAVKDSGMGMTQADLTRIFNKFARAEAAQKIDPNGLGLGLYFVKRVVEDHGGRVWAESEGPGKGSTFFVELPIPQTQKK